MRAELPFYSHPLYKLRPFIEPCTEKNIHDYFLMPSHALYSSIIFPYSFIE